MTGIIDYQTGNLRSIENALYRAGEEYRISSDLQELAACERIILPGVGDAGWAMRRLRELRLEESIRQITRPVLGICLGMQLLCRFSEEGDTPCLGIFDRTVSRLRPEPGIKVPHTGWNTIEELSSPLFRKLPERPFVYFVHSYRADTGTETIAAARYGREKFSAALQKENFFGCQFHPEKSGETGAKILLNFLGEK